MRISSLAYDSYDVTRIEVQVVNLRVGNEILRANQPRTQPTFDERREAY